MKIGDEFTYPPEHFYRKCHFKIKDIYKGERRQVIAIDLNETLGNRFVCPVIYSWLESALEQYAAWIIKDGKDVRKANVKSAMAATEFMPKGAKVPLDAGIDGLDFQTPEKSVSQ